MPIGPLAVTFSRLEADGKLVMGYRKAPTSLSSQVRAHYKHSIGERVGNAAETIVWFELSSAFFLKCPSYYGLEHGNPHIEIGDMVNIID